MSTSRARPGQRKEYQEKDEEGRKEGRAGVKVRSKGNAVEFEEIQRVKRERERTSYVTALSCEGRLAPVLRASRGELIGGAGSSPRRGSRGRRSDVCFRSSDAQAASEVGQRSDVAAHHGVHVPDARRMGLLAQAVEVAVVVIRVTETGNGGREDHTPSTYFS